MAAGGRDLPPHHHHHHERDVVDRGGDSALLVLPAWSLKAAKEATSTPLDPHCSELRTNSCEEKGMQSIQVSRSTLALIL
jgi:hypothetical protein